MHIWHSLPTEMKLAVVDILDIEDAKTFAKVDRNAYTICVAVLFRTVKLDSFNALSKFLHSVPRSYFQHIRDLNVCTSVAEGTLQSDVSTNVPSLHPATDALASLLSACSGLEHLSLQLANSLADTIIPSFSHLSNLKRLAISNCGDEEHALISERLVVSIAASLPTLEQLSLDRISRSTLHAPELVGVYPYIPLVTGDESIPDHPMLGPDLSLPSLLRIPSLRKLTIRDTHLGDPRWATTPVACRLEILDLGSCPREHQHFNTICTERIMAAVGPTVQEFSLATAVSDPIFDKHSVTPLRSLRKLHIAPFFPLDSVVTTVVALAGSPIESLSVQCFEDDLVDTCSELEAFLTLRVERGADFYQNLARIDVSVTPNDDDDDDEGGYPHCAKVEEKRERALAARRLQELCCDLCLASNAIDAALAGGPVSDDDDDDDVAHVAGYPPRSCGEQFCQVR